MMNRDPENLLYFLKYNEQELRQFIIENLPHMTSSPMGAIRKVSLTHDPNPRIRQRQEEAERISVARKKQLEGISRRGISTAYLVELYLKWGGNRLNLEKFLINPDNSERLNTNLTEQ